MDKLLLESGDALLTESGDHILLDYGDFLLEIMERLVTANEELISVVTILSNHELIRKYE